MTIYETIDKLMEAREKATSYHMTARGYHAARDGFCTMAIMLIPDLHRGMEELVELLERRKKLIDSAVQSGSGNAYSENRREQDLLASVLSRLKGKP